MKIYREENLLDFDFWSGARTFAMKLDDDELCQIESILEDLYPDGIDETGINDFFWFESETICEWLGTTEEEFLAR